MPRKRDQKLAEWRKEAPIRPVIFADSGELTEDVVHLHLEQRVAQRLLARFRSQGFIFHDLSRACLAQSTDAIPRVILLGRLSLYGRGAERLHEEIVPLTARWVDPAQRKTPLTPYGREAETKTLDLLGDALGDQTHSPNETIQELLLSSAARDIEELLPHLEPRAEELARGATERLQKRGEQESDALRETLERQRKHVGDALSKHQASLQQLALGFSDEDRKQLEANMRSWRTRIDQFERDLQNEPRRIREFYEVRVKRIEPVGLVYLWPESN